MFQLVLALFALAAVTGLYLVINYFQGQTLTLGPAIAHGLFAAGGLVGLVTLGLRSGLSGLLLYSLVLFVVAALGGFFLFSFHLRGKQLPGPVVVVHALVAVVAFVLLLTRMVI